MKKIFNTASSYLMVIVSSVLLAAGFARAMSVEPMVLDVASIGTNTTTSFKVSNPGTSSLPVEITVSEIDIGRDGETINEPADDMLLIYPPQADIEPGGAQTFRVQWIGDPEIPTSRNYRVSVAQVPVKRPEQSSGIQLVLSFGVLLSVSPPESSSDIVVSKVAPITDQDGKTSVALSVKNPGNKYAFMRQAAIRLHGNSNWSANLNAVEVEKKLGLGIVQPGKERRFLIPMDVPPGVSDITASIDYKPEN